MALRSSLIIYIIPYLVMINNWCEMLQMDCSGLIRGHLSWVLHPSFLFQNFMTKMVDT